MWSCIESPCTNCLTIQIKHAGSLWRGRLKDKILDLMHEWNTRPSAMRIEADSMQEEQIRAFVARRVSELLFQDAFCNSGKDEWVR